MLRLNSKRTPKPSGKKKKIRNLDENDELFEAEIEEQLEEEVAEEKTKPGKKKTGKPELVTDFTSSNLQGVAYDPEKKTMWIRFQNGAVYQYWNVPLNVYRDFWKASSKGKYFWAKVRRNYSIPYKKLSSSLMFIPVEKMGPAPIKIISSKATLQLQAAKTDLQLYTATNAAIQKMLVELNKFKCPGFEDLSKVTIRFAGSYIDIYTDKCELWINYYKDTYYVTIFVFDLETESSVPLATFSCTSEEFELGAANEVFAYIESLKEV